MATIGFELLWLSMVHETVHDPNESDHKKSLKILESLTGQAKKFVAKLTNFSETNDFGDAKKC